MLAIAVGKVPNTNDPGMLIILPLGIVQAICLVLYVVPRTSVLGAVLGVILLTCLIQIGQDLFSPSGDRFRDTSEAGDVAPDWGAETSATGIPARMAAVSDSRRRRVSYS